jgi:hypothetical protein
MTTKLICTEQKIHKKFHKANVSGQAHEFPIIGTVTFDKENSIEVETSKVETFLKLDCGFKFIKAENNKKEQKKEEVKDEIVETDPKKIYAKELKLLPTADLESLLSIHPEKETKKLNGKDAQIGYLVNKQFPKKKS